MPAADAEVSPVEEAVVPPKAEQTEAAAIVETIQFSEQSHPSTSRFGMESQQGSEENGLKSDPDAEEEQKQGQDPPRVNHISGIPEEILPSREKEDDPCAILHPSHSSHPIPRDQSQEVLRAHATSDTVLVASPTAFKSRDSSVFPNGSNMDSSPGQE